MCSRYTLTSPPEAVRAYFRTGGQLAFPPRYNIAPTQPVTIVRAAPDGTREMALVRWGLIPPWVKTPAEFTVVLNARAETIIDKPSFRGAIRHRRCLVPADGYYEWTGPARAKQPHLVHRRDRDQPLMGLAGLHEHWLGADGSELESMAIVTTAANADTNHIHDRMPLVLSPETFDVWLDTSPGSATPILGLLTPPRPGQLAVQPVSRALNNSRNEGAALLDYGAPSEPASRASAEVSPAAEHQGKLF